jgi:hypothetical protein
VIITHLSNQIVQAPIGHARQVGGGMGGVTAPAAIALKHSDTPTGSLKEVCGCQPGKTSAYNRDIDVQVPIERWVRWTLDILKPVWPLHLAQRFDTARLG